MTPFHALILLHPIFGVNTLEKWNGSTIVNWTFVRNKLAMDDKLQARILKYEEY